MMSWARPILGRSINSIFKQPSVKARKVQLLVSPLHTSTPHQLAKKPTSALAQLRKQTGYSLSLCKKALAENDQDVAKAKGWLDEQAQEQGWNKANKLQGRNTTQGLVGLQVSQCGLAAAMVELNREAEDFQENCGTTRIFTVCL